MTGPKLPSLHKAKNLISKVGLAVGKISSTVLTNLMLILIKRLISILLQILGTLEIGGGERGFDGGKKVKGRKRHIVVDALGLVLVVLVHAGNIADVTAARMLLVDLSLTQPTVEHIWADQGYQGPKLQAVAATCGLTLEVVKRNSPGFEVLPRRWVVERTFAWLGKHRRLGKDYERLPEVSEAVVHVAMIPLLLNRLLSS